MKAEVKKIGNPLYNYLIIPKEGFAPLLFLEWASENKTSPIASIRNDIENNIIIISLHSYSEIPYQEAVNYINANL